MLGFCEGRAHGDLKMVGWIWGGGKFYAHIRLIDVIFFCEYGLKLVKLFFKGEKSY